MAERGTDRQRVATMNVRAQTIAIVLAALTLALGVGFAVLSWLEKSA